MCHATRRVACASTPRRLEPRTASPICRATGCGPIRSRCRPSWPVCSLDAIGSAGGRRRRRTHQSPTFPPDPKSPPLAAFWDIGTNVPGGLPLTPWAAAFKKQRMATDEQGQPGRELHADGLPAVPHAAAAAEDHPDAEADRDPVRGELRPAPHLHWTAARCRRRASRSRGGTATRSAAGKATRSSSRPTTCAAPKRARTTGGWT